MDGRDRGWPEFFPFRWSWRLLSKSPALKGRPTTPRATAVPLLESRKCWRIVDGAVAERGLIRSRWGILRTGIVQFGDWVIWRSDLATVTTSPNRQMNQFISWQSAPTETSPRDSGSDRDSVRAAPRPSSDSIRFARAPGRRASVRAVRDRCLRPAAPLSLQDARA